MIHTANGAMNTSTLLDYAVRVIPKKSRNNSAKSIKKWLEVALENTSVFLDRSVTVLTGTGTSDTQTESSSSTGINVPNLHDGLRAFTDNLKAPTEVYEKIPFYYRQLFVGRQSAKPENLMHRGPQLARALSLMKPHSGKGSSLIVMGGPLTGKSVFAETLANDVGQGEVIKIQPPIAGSTSAIDLNRMLEKLSGIHGKGKSVLKSAKKGTVFLFEDIELWWSRGDTKNSAIRYLVDLINNDENVGKIIVTCNPYAFKIMEGQGLLADLILPRIALPLMDKAALKDILLNRHLAGGLMLRLNGQNENELSNKKLLKLIDRCHENSSGLVGVALHQWLNNIKSYHEETIDISFPIVQPLPEITEKEWLVLICQFIIHKYLDAKRVQKLFNYRDQKKADRMIRQLLADGILDEVLGSAYRVNPLVQAAFIKKGEGLGLI
jgi:hypothetical protein